MKSTERVKHETTTNTIRGQLKKNAGRILFTFQQIFICDDDKKINCFFFILSLKCLYYISVLSQDCANCAPQ